MRTSTRIEIEGRLTYLKVNTHTDAHTRFVDSTSVLCVISLALLPRAARGRGRRRGAWRRPARGSCTAPPTRVVDNKRSSRDGSMTQWYLQGKCSYKRTGDSASVKCLFSMSPDRAGGSLKTSTRADMRA